MTSKSNIAKRKAIAKYEVLFGAIFLTCGCAIYLLFRSKSLNIYQWCMPLGLANIIDSLRHTVQNWDIAAWIKYSLPDAKKWKYVEKIMDSLMEKYNYTYMRTPIFESSDLFHRGVGETTDIVTKETYDVKDLVCYSFPLIIYFIYIYILKLSNK